ncbi:uncharacterized protein B0I36DRAFT_357624 [Microdochium trichocladiopsis]|uniref:Peroxin 20 n=1 Tax=Microdochium trichocladiopsis TaxID=1682393 RepID=A0A9P8YI04_9PEZI|nr:uncharacterized protein B0I36DRAFT_357624 [Microdochium trichocladiopsis]KAH7040308.1 hypothetical protein B0I36DRAFT_357624 [Microdochium trichocladiopsis]
MADAMCGPANALKGLAGHLDRDGSRQQDRFVASPHSAAQNFRSSPANGSSANTSFAAFQSGNSGLPSVLDGGLAGSTLHAPPPAGLAGFQARQPWQMNTAPAAISQAPQTQQGGQSWISDFQQMNVNGAMQHPAQPNLTPQAAPQYNPMFAPQRPMLGGPMYGFNNSVAPMALQGPAQATPTQVTQADDDFDFDAAMSQWMAANSGPEEEAAAATSLADSLNQAEAEQQLPAEPVASSSDVLHQEPVQPVQETVVPAEEAEAPATPGHDNGELAAAARQVVQSVSNETNDKFAKSDFFAFMRRLGNEEIVLRGTEFVEAGAADDQAPSATTSPTANREPNLQPTVEDD